MGKLLLAASRFLLCTVLLALPAIATAQAPFTVTTAATGTPSPTTGQSQSAQTVNLTGIVHDFCGVGFGAATCPTGYAPHPDFENGVVSDDPGLVRDTLGDDGTPVPIGPFPSATVHSADSFSQWYHDKAGINKTTTVTLPLINQYGSGFYLYNSNNFFPIDNQLLGNQGQAHNYSFTLDIHTTFKYAPGQMFELTADDDAWVFINNRLVIDLGGVHPAEVMSVDLDKLGLTAGHSYNFDLFFAERQAGQSDLRLDTNIVFNSSPPIYLSEQPAGKAPNLVVLVHGCCTDANDVSKDWREFANKIIKKIAATNTSRAWEVVVWDWHKDTPKHNYLATAVADGVLPAIALIKADADAAYENAKNLSAADLSTAISPYNYKYIHFIGHSAGAKLIDMTANNLAALYNNVPSLAKPFIQLTFLDAYTKTPADSGEEGGEGYGYLDGYPDDSHYSEHYVDRGFASTDACLSNAFNFDITNWDGADKNPLNPHSGHTWPIRWYAQSVTGSGFHYGYPLSLEGSDKNINTLIKELSNYPPGEQCSLSDIGASCIKALCPSSGSF